MEFIVKIPSEIDKVFIQRMINAMTMSFYKYGPVKEAYPSRVDAMKSLEVRLNKYKETGNSEWLIDTANFCMIEYMFPSHPNAHYAPTDNNASPGRVWRGEVNPVKDRNDLK